MRPGRDARTGGGPWYTGGGSQTARGPHTQGLSSGSSRLPEDKRRRCVFRRLTTLSSACQAPEKGKARLLELDLRIGPDGVPSRAAWEFGTKAGRLPFTWSSHGVPTTAREESGAVVPTGPGTVADTGAHNGGTHGMVPAFWDLALGPTFVSLFGLNVCFSVTTDKEKKLGLAEIFVRQEEVDGRENNRLIWAQSECLLWGPGWSRKCLAVQRVPGAEWHGGGQCNGHSSLSAPKQPAEVCYQLVPSTPGDVSPRAVGSHGNHPLNSSSCPQAAAPALEAPAAHAGNAHSPGFGLFSPLCCVSNHDLWLVHPLLLL